MSTKYQVIAKYNGTETKLLELFDFLSLAEIDAERLRAEAAVLHGPVEIWVVAVEVADEGRA